jgi:hypothetical protein
MTVKTKTSDRAVKIVKLLDSPDVRALGAQLDVALLGLRDNLTRDDGIFDTSNIADAQTQLRGLSKLLNTLLRELRPTHEALLDELDPGRKEVW